MTAALTNLTKRQITGADRIEGGLDLSGLTEIPSGFNPTVGGSLDLRNGLPAPCRKPVFPLCWNNHVYADGILSAVLHQRGNVYRVKNVGQTKPSYLVTAGTNWSHGDSLKEAKADLVYKVTDRKPEQYAGLKLGSKLTFAEAIACYRCVTGACAAGVKHFVQSSGATEKSVTIREIVRMTKGQYGHERFAEFFSGKANA